MGKEIQSVCFTGTCPDHTRAELIEMAEDQFEIKDSVTKDLDILVCADPNANSSKLQKAAKNGVKIISYDDFLEMLEGEGDEDEEDDEYDDEEEESNPLYDLMDYLEEPKVKIDAEKVKKVEEAYGIKAPDALKRMVSKCGRTFDDYISNSYQNCFRILTFDEVVDPSENIEGLKMDFKKKNCVPIADCMNNDYIVYNYKNNTWMWINDEASEGEDIAKEDLYIEHDSLRVVLNVIDDENG